MEPKDTEEAAAEALLQRAHNDTNPIQLSLAIKNLREAAYWRERAHTEKAERRRRDRRGSC